MSTERQQPVDQRTSSPSGVAVSLLVLASAILVGSAGGILIADRQASGGRTAAAPARSLGPSTAQPPTDGLAVNKTANSGAEKSTDKPSRDILKSASLSIGTIKYSEQPDSASTAIELGPAVVVGTGKAHDPERIYFDLRDSRHPDAPVDRFKGMETFQTDGTLVARVRVSAWESGAVRIVLDVTMPCDYTYEIAAGPPPRLDVKLHPRAPGEQASAR